MRIIGGIARSRRLKAPKGAATRPTADRVREALFSMLGAPCTDARVLDLFAGAGSLGLEALSRGAMHAVFVDKAPSALSCLRHNIGALKMDDRAEIIADDAMRALRRMATERRVFHWVFIDPPYASELTDAVLEALGTSALLADSATVLVEHDRRRSLEPTAGVLRVTDQRVWGDTAVSFYGKVTP